MGRGVRAADRRERSSSRARRGSYIRAAAASLRGAVAAAATRAARAATAFSVRVSHRRRSRRRADAPRKGWPSLQGGVGAPPVVAFLPIPRVINTRRRATVWLLTAGSARGGFTSKRLQLSLRILIALSALRPRQGHRVWLGESGPVEFELTPVNPGRWHGYLGCLGDAFASYCPRTLH